MSGLSDMLRNECEETRMYPCDKDGNAYASDGLTPDKALKLERERASRLGEFPQKPRKLK